LVAGEHDVEPVRLLHYVAALGLDYQRGLSDEALECPLRTLVVWSVGFIGEQERALPHVVVEAVGEMDGRADMARVLAEDFAHHFARRAPTGAALAPEHERGFGLLVGILHGPRQPVDGIEVNVIVTCGHHFEDVIAHQSPLAALGCHAPTGPEIELAVDDGLAVRLEDDAGILPSVFVREPELADIDDRTLMFDMAIQIEETKVFGTQ